MSSAFFWGIAVNDPGKKKEALWQQFLDESGARRVSPSMKIFLVLLGLGIGWLVLANWMR